MAVGNNVLTQAMRNVVVRSVAARDIFRQLPSARTHLPCIRATTSGTTVANYYWHQSRKIRNSIIRSNLIYGYIWPLTQDSHKGQLRVLFAENRVRFFHEI